MVDGPGSGDNKALDVRAAPSPMPPNRLDFNSDFTSFLRPGISDDDHRLAMRQLWASSDMFGRHDGLDVYCGDYRCASDAPAVDDAARKHQSVTADRGSV